MKDLLLWFDMGDIERMSGTLGFKSMLRKYLEIT
jgi:hypothetical protein